MHLRSLAFLVTGTFTYDDYDGLKCGLKDWKTQMPSFNQRNLNRTWKRARLKLFGGEDASDSWNWVAHVSEIGYRTGK